MPVQLTESLLLQARSKWDIPNELRGERPKVSLQAAVEIAKELRPNAVLRSITNTYNCGGMVFGMRRVWIYPEHFLKILMEDGYKQLARPEDAERGDVVIYYDEKNEPTHAGIIIGKRVLQAGQNSDFLVVMSKWGGDGEYFHDLSEVPAYLGRPAEFWTDRRTV